MKRNLTTVIAILLALGMLAGCASPAELPKGSVKDNVYTNDFAELTFTAPVGWYLILQPYKVRSFFWSDGFPLDMNAFDTVTGSDVAVAYADLAAAGKTDCGEEAYFDLMKEKAVKLNPDIDFNFGDYTDVKVGSNSFKVMHVSFTDSAYSYNANYYIRRKDNCMIIISASIRSDGDIDSVMANFS